MITTPRIEYRPARHLAVIRTKVPIPFGKYMAPLYREVDKWMAARGITDSGAAVIRYLTTDMSKLLDIEVGFELMQPVEGDERVSVVTLPAGQHVTMMYTGSYRGKGLYKATVALFDWAGKNDVKWDVENREGVEWWNSRLEVYLTDPAKEKDVSKYETELVFRIKQEG